MKAKEELGLLLVSASVALIVLAGVALVVAGLSARGRKRITRFLADRDRIRRLVVIIAGLAIVAATVGLVWL